MSYKQTIDINNQNSNSAGTNYLTIKNDSNTAGSRAIVAAQVAGTTADDAMFQALISGGQSWSLGVDNSDSDAFVIAASSTLGSTNVMRSSIAGEITQPLQPAFSAYVTTDILNVTGDGTAYTVIFNGERFDQNSDFNTTTGTFTAPVTGKYYLTFGISMIQVDSSMTTFYMEIVTSNQTYRANQLNPINALTSGRYSSVMSVIADMDAADTSTCIVYLSGSTKTADVQGGFSWISHFIGYLAS